MPVSVIVVGFGAEPTLGACLDAIAGELRPDDQLILVDNGITGSIPSTADAELVTSGRNRGFAGGCALGVAAARNSILVFVNSDAVIAPGTVAALASTASDPGVGLVTGCVTLAADDSLVNSVGNPVHFLGLSWAGGLGEPVALHQEPKDVASVSGALFAMRRDVWESTGGLDELFFMYHEDTDLSLRCHLSALRVVYCPAARASHEYEFRRNPEKLALLERHRLAIVLTVYGSRTLFLILPAMIAFELCVCALAVRDGWFRAKWRGWVWIVENRHLLRLRRSKIQSTRSVSDAMILDVLTGDFSPGKEANLSIGGPARAVSRAYWAVAKAAWRSWAVVRPS